MQVWGMSDLGTDSGGVKPDVRIAGKPCLTSPYLAPSHT